MRIKTLIALALTFGLATAAHAQTAATASPVPEAANTALFALGLLGLIIGRRAGRNR